MSQIDIDRAETLAGDYDMLMELIRTRTSVRKLKGDPIPDECVTKVLEAGRWAIPGLGAKSRAAIKATVAMIRLGVRMFTLGRPYHIGRGDGNQAFRRLHCDMMKIVSQGAVAKW